MSIMSIIISIDIRIYVRIITNNSFNSNDFYEMINFSTTL